MRVLAALIAATLLMSTAAADDPSKDQAKQTTKAQFKALDRDQDGRLSKNEARDETELSAQFNSYDANSDGYVTETEYVAMARPKKDWDRKEY